MSSRQADLRHEPRLGRLPDERISRGRPARAARRRRRPTTIHPLAMRAVDADGGDAHGAAPSTRCRCSAQTYQAAKLRIAVDGQVRLEELICDGVLVATPGRLDRLQPLRPRADPADQRAAAGADADQRRSGPGAGAARCCRTRQGRHRRARSPTSGRSARWPTISRSATWSSVEVEQDRGDRPHHDVRPRQ